MSVNWTRVEDKMRRFMGKCALFCFNKSPIYNHYDASAKYSTNSHETGNSVLCIFLEGPPRRDFRRIDFHELLDSIAEAFPD